MRSLGGGRIPLWRHMRKGALSTDEPKPSFDSLADIPARDFANKPLVDVAPNGRCAATGVPAMSTLRPDSSHLSPQRLLTAVAWTAGMVLGVACGQHLTVLAVLACTVAVAAVVLRDR